MQSLKSAVAATALALAVCAGTAAPARADGAASTRNIILGVGAVAAGAVVTRNVAHKRKLHTTVRGYTRNGGTVYQDGHVVRRDGTSYYPGNYGRSVSCNGYGGCAVQR